MGNKPYQPDRFTQVLSPVETIQAENEQLKHLVNTKLLFKKKVEKKLFSR